MSDKSAWTILVCGVGTIIVATKENFFSLLAMWVVVFAVNGAIWLFRK